jgi:hypothetical protein
VTPLQRQLIIDAGDRYETGCSHGSRATSDSIGRCAEKRHDPAWLSHARPEHTSVSDLVEISVLDLEPVDGGTR